MSPHINNDDIDEDEFADELDLKGPLAMEHLHIQDDEDDDQLTQEVTEEKQSLFQWTVEWVSRNVQYIFWASGILLVCNTWFFMFTMGYLLKEEHVVVRAMKFPKQSPSNIWRLITDVEGYPAWRKGVTKVKVVTGKDVKTGSLVGSSHVEYHGFGTKGPYIVTEEEQTVLLVRKTHPDYTPAEYAQPVVLTGAPIAADVNSKHKQQAKLEAEEKRKAEIESQLLLSPSELQKKKKQDKKQAEQDASKPLNLPMAPFFLPFSIPTFTETWTFELEPILNKDTNTTGCVLYVTYQGTIANRLYRFAKSLWGYDQAVEKFLSSLATLVGQQNAMSIRPVKGQLIVE
ncbi:hypothetical protein HDU76_001485 [Blyttiomyces sp. JEL0837]|nr:hypothetical protein HDU76_001485 [Blyttiomyces sp. JEL0837]